MYRSYGARGFVCRGRFLTTCCPYGAVLLIRNLAPIRVLNKGFRKHRRLGALCSMTLYLGESLMIDCKTELSTDKAAYKLFTREYRKGFELPEPANV
jgi:hypothetical protein